MIYLEEHRDVGDSVHKADELAHQHEEYASNAMVSFKHEILGFYENFEYKKIVIHQI